MSYTGLALSGGAGALSSTSGTVAPGDSSSGNVAFIPVASGSVTFSPSVTSATNVNITTSANAGTTSGVTVLVYNPASANSVVSAVSLGNVYASGTFGTQSLSIWNTGTAAAAYQEGLAAAVSGTSGQATGSGSFTNLFTSSTSTAISIGLGGNADLAVAEGPDAGDGAEQRRLAGAGRADQQRRARGTEIERAELHDRLGRLNA